jgi:hypothetical protein
LRRGLRGDGAQSPGPRRRIYYLKDNRRYVVFE